MEGEASGLSAGRSRRSTAGNRMRELLEQERERLEAKRGNEDDEMFQEEEGDIDFEAKVEDVEDIIDSDFDQSSEEGEDGEDDLEGEREIEEEEKAAKKASRVKTAPIGIRRTAPVSKSNRVEESERQSSPSTAPKTKRITFTASSSAGQGGIQRSSKRKSTIDATMSVQARMKLEEKRRQEVMERAAPKRKKVRLSQADRIGEALEMEEQNRASLKRFLELEEERRERDRKRGKREIEGPFIRFHSIAEDRNASLRKRRIEEIIDTREKEKVKSVTIAIPASTLTEDPVFAAREAARKERQIAEVNETFIVETDSSAQSRANAEENAKPQISKIKSMEIPDEEIAASGTSSANAHQTDHPDIIEAEAGDAQIESIIDNAEVGKVSQEQAGQESETRQEDESQEDIIIGTQSSPAVSRNETDKEANNARQQAESEKHNITQIKKLDQEVDFEKRTEEQEEEALFTNEKIEAATQIEMDYPKDIESRTYISLHQLEVDSPWHVTWSYVLGSHVDWSNYPLVPARNRPLRPRQSICPITGLSANYRDPRTGIAFANKEAYLVITRLMSGHYLWSGKPVSCEDGLNQEQIMNTNYEPLEMGCWLDHIEEGGACNVINVLTNKMNNVVVAPAGSRSKGSIAPGDEQALVAAAQALPAGTTRSGGRRSTNNAT